MNTNGTIIDVTISAEKTSANARLDSAAFGFDRLAALAALNDAGKTRLYIAIHNLT